MRMAVKPFTPPLFGWVRVRNIVIYHLPHVGSGLMIMAVVMLAMVLKRGGRRGGRSEIEATAEAGATIV